MVSNAIASRARWAAALVSALGVSAMLVAAVAFSAPPRVELVGPGGTGRGVVRLIAGARGRPMVHVDELGLLFGVRVEREDGTGRVRIVGPAGEAAFVEGGSRFLVRLHGAGPGGEAVPDEAGRLVRLEAPAAYLGGRLAVPAAFLTEVLPLIIGARLRGDLAEGVLVIESGAPALELAAIEETPAPPVGLSGRRIVVDPAHGGSEAGLRQDPFLEKERSLVLAEVLRQQLAAEGARVLLTREVDLGRGAAERAGMANAFAAEAVVSLHLGERLGAMVYEPSVPAPAVDPQSVALLPWSAAPLAASARSRQLAMAMLTSLGGGPGDLLAAPLLGLAGLQAPAVAIEVPWATSTATLTTAAQALTEGLRAFFEAE